MSLIHELNFSSSWMQYFNKYLTVPALRHISEAISPLFPLYLSNNSWFDNSLAFISSLLSPGATPPGGCQKSIKNRPTTTISNQTTATTSFIIFFILILQTDYDIFLGRGGFPPRNLSDTLYNHFDNRYESSNF